METSALLLPFTQQHKAEVPFRFLFKSYNRSLFPAIRRGASAMLVVITAKAHRISEPPKKHAR